MVSGFEYASPTSVEDAVSRLSTSDDAVVLAGGQALLNEMKGRRLPPGLLVDLGHVDGLARLGPSPDGGWHTGAMATLDAIAGSGPLAAGDSALTDCIGQFGDPQVRNRATIGGGLVNAHPGVDLPAVALAMGAVIHIAGPDGPGVAEAGARLGTGQIVTGVDWPAATAGSGSAYEKARNPASSYAICGAAVAVTVAADGTVEACRVAVSGAAAPAVRLPKVEAALLGQPATPDSFTRAAGRVVDEGVDFADDVAAPSAYRAHLAGVLVARALARATARARKASA